MIGITKRKKKRKRDSQTDPHHHEILNLRCQSRHLPSLGFILHLCKPSESRRTRINWTILATIYRKHSLVFLHWLRTSSFHSGGSPTEVSFNRFSMDPAHRISPTQDLQTSCERSMENRMISTQALAAGKGTHTPLLRRSSPATPP